MIILVVVPSILGVFAFILGIVRRQRKLAVSGAILAGISLLFWAAFFSGLSGK